MGRGGKKRKEGGGEKVKENKKERDRGKTETAFQTMGL